MNNTLYTTAQVRELDRIAIQEQGIPGYELMTRAGQKTFEHIQRQWSQVTSISIYCGSGNNGGDGYVVGRLALQANWQVQLFALSDTATLQGDARQAYEDYLTIGGAISTFNGSLPEADIVLDAMLGTGLDREVGGIYADVIALLNKSKQPVVAVDIPSGLNGDTGQVWGIAVEANMTVTFIGQKAGLYTGKAKDHCGDVYFDDLQVPASVYANITSEQYLLNQSITEKLSPRKRTAHKGNAGHSLLVGGASGMSGAIRLAGEAALRTGSGLVTIATAAEHAALINLTRPELMVTTPDATVAFNQLLQKVSVIGIGPGLGQTTWASRLLTLVENSSKPKVLDADALNLLAQTRLKRDDWILTPHPGEAARLLACEIKAIEQDRIQSAKALQQQYGGVVVLKGAGTVIASNNRISLCPAGNPGMASGGMGDVLTGIITALLAQGLSLVDAAETGVCIHAYAADEAAKMGERGLLASDLIGELRNMINAYPL
jgi:NAD(P)H-hydrate epimerase